MERFCAERVFVNFNQGHFKLKIFDTLTNPIPALFERQAKIFVFFLIMI